MAEQLMFRPKTESSFCCRSNYLLLHLFGPGTKISLLLFDLRHSHDRRLADHVTADDFGQTPAQFGFFKTTCEIYLALGV